MQVDNSIYSTLGARWYEAKDDPVALLRAESRLRNPWIGHILEQTFDHACTVLDMGCGAGFLANDLAARGHHVVGVDAAPEALAVARLHDGTRSVNYRWCDALDLPFPSGSFEAVCAMDVLGVARLRGLERGDRAGDVLAEELGELEARFGSVERLDGRAELILICEESLCRELRFGQARDRLDDVEARERGVVGPKAAHFAPELELRDDARGAVVLAAELVVLVVSFPSSAFVMPHGSG